MSQSKTKKCGHIAFVGRPNAGKSTLLNRIIGEKVSIVSDKPQTTRHRILGMLNDEEKQLIFVDTPGIHRPGFRLNERMMEVVYGALKEVDVVVHLVDCSEKFGKGEAFALDLVNAFEGPLILALNKVDLISKSRLLPMMESYNELGKYAAIVPISAASGDGTAALIEEISKRVPEHEVIYPPDQHTDQLERTLVGEIVREKVLLNTRQELPYSTAVKVEEFNEEEREKGFVRISASIIVERPGQKKIVIGRGGKMVKTIGTKARKEIQRLLGVPKVYLELHVKVTPDWRNREHLLTNWEFTEAPMSNPVVDQLRFFQSLGVTHLNLGTEAAEPSATPQMESLGDVREWIGDCQRCKLASGRHNIVFGVGNPQADLMFVGEAPGFDEDRQGEPFVGKAGQLLTRIIETMFDAQREDVYIANILKCRPPGNRDPEPDEVESCQSFLHEQIRLVSPQIIVALGRYAAQTLLQTTTPISRLRGKFYEYRGTLLFPTFHPSYLLRNPAKKREVFHDMKAIRARLEG